MPPRASGSNREAPWFSKFNAADLELESGTAAPESEPPTPAQPAAVLQEGSYQTKVHKQNGAHACRYRVSYTSRVCLYIYVYMHICIHVYIYICMNCTSMVLISRILVYLNKYTYIYVYLSPEVVFQRAGGDVFDTSFSTPPQKSSVEIDEIFAESAKNAALPAGGHAISKWVLRGHNLNGRSNKQNIG